MCLWFVGEKGKMGEKNKQVLLETVKKAGQLRLKLRSSRSHTYETAWEVEPTSKSRHKWQRLHSRSRDSSKRKSHESQRILADEKTREKGEREKCS